ncbi:hypothetical protein Tco_1330232 [Tanacetum coccineum]
MTHPSPKRNMIPKAVLMRSGLVSLTTARPVNTAQPRTTVKSARPMTNVFNKAHSTVRRPINNKIATKKSNFNQGVNTVKDKNVNTARPKAIVNTAKPKAVFKAVKGNQVNAVKASACWVWKPKTKGNPQMDLQDQGVIDSGCSRYMTRNMSYLTNFEEIDGGYVAFGGNPKGGKITDKVRIVNGEQQLQALVDGKKIVVTKEFVRRDLQLDDEEGTDCLPNATIFEKLTRMGAKTTAWNEFSSTMASAIICLATNQKFKFSKYIFESMVKNFDNAGKFLMYPSDPTIVADKAVNEEPSMQLKELMDFYTKLQQRVLDLENTKTAQAQEITSLKKRVKKLEKKGGSRTHKLRRLYKVGISARVVSSVEASLGDQEDASKQGRKINDIDADEDITLENVHDAEMFDVNDLHGDEVFVEKEVPVKEVSAVGKVNTASIATTVSAATITEDEITLAQALAELKSVKPKVTTATTTTTKGILLQEPSESTTTTTTPSKDKAEFDEEVRLAREKDEANVALIEEWNDIQAKIETDYELAQRLQAEEQEELTVDEKATLFQQLLEKRRKHFAAKRAEEKRNRPPTRAQQRSIMCTYLKNMAGWKPKDLKIKSFAYIQELFDKAFKRVGTFVDFTTELVEGTEMEETSKKAEITQESSSKRAGDELEQENAKKQKVDDDQEAAKMKELMKIVPDEEEVALDAIPLATKPPSIIGWKIVNEVKINYYQIIRADGSSKRYSAFIQMLRSFDKEDLETLWKLVKAKHGYTRPEEGYERVLWGDLKKMFEHHVEDAVWRNLQENKVLV